MANEEQECGNCVYYRYIKKQCECHFDPPIIVAKHHPSKSTEILTEFPKVATSNWCGKWAERKSSSQH